MLIRATAELQEQTRRSGVIGVPSYSLGSERRGGAPARLCQNMQEARSCLVLAAEHGACMEGAAGASSFQARVAVGR